MNKSTELKTTTDLVKGILQRCPEARNSDNILYYYVCGIIGNENGIDIEKMSMPTFFLNLKKYGFPAFESVRRTRQKLQAEYPELSGNERVQSQRMMNEESFRNYARSNV